MGRRTDPTDDGKRIIVKELANATTPEMIASKINRHVVTVSKFANDPLKKRKIPAKPALAQKVRCTPSTTY